MAEKEKKLPVARRVWDMAEPLCRGLGLSLWDVRFEKEGSQWYLRVFIDKDGGVSIDDCVDLTHALDPLLDEADPIPQEYLLEVSSPGFERKLTRKEHLLAFIGSPVRVKLIRPMENGERLIEGELLGVDENGAVEVQIDGETSAVIEKKECSSINLIEEL